MERHIHSMSNLFAQLGQPSDDAAIAQFIKMHGSLASSVPLHEAPFWSPAQTDFLREAVLNDADWAEVVEALNTELHAHR